MTRNSCFKFKQFTIQQANAAMKVGTDGILLGAWVDVSNCTRILDVGTGTGLIALMMAQRSKAQVSAIEIEKNAASEAMRNVVESPWSEKLTVEHISFQNYARKCSQSYDLIVSNPPFFNQSLKAGNNERTLARHTDALPFDELVEDSFKLLSKTGRFALVLPVKEAELLKHFALDMGMFLIRETIVKPKPGRDANRILLEYGKKQVRPIMDGLTIYEENGV